MFSVRVQQYVISYAGASRWMMQGVQVGGPRSKFGVIGTWSTADHEGERERAELVALALWVTC